MITLVETEGGSNSTFFVTPMVNVKQVTIEIDECGEVKIASTTVYN